MLEDIESGFHPIWQSLICQGGEQDLSQIPESLDPCFWLSVVRRGFLGLARGIIAFLLFFLGEFFFENFGEAFVPELPAAISVETGILFSVYQGLIESF
jgi:hypothetical protein